MPPKKGTSGGIEVGKMHLTRVKSKERGRDFDFVLDGEVVNSAKISGKSGRGGFCAKKVRNLKRRES